MTGRPQQADPAREAKIEVEVDVFRTAGLPGDLGNSPSGRYRFVLSRDTVHVHARDIDTRIRYRLTKDALARGFSFIDAYTTDLKFQLTGPYLGLAEQSDDDGAEKIHDTIEFVHSNTHASLISVSLQVIDHRAPPELRRIAHDPQITNQPGNN